MSVDTDPDLVQQRHSLAFTYLSFQEHCAKLLSHWKVGSLGFISCLSVLWLLLEPLALFPNFELKSRLAYPLLFTISAAFSIGSMLTVYLRHIPKGYENETKQVQRIVRLKRLMWEFRAMRLMLEDRIGNMDKRLDDLANNKAFVERTSMGVLEYNKWIGDRPGNVLDMVEVAKNVLIFDFPQYLQMGDDMDAIAKNLLKGANLVSNFYQDIVDFEMKSYSIKPPDKLQRVHEIQAKWTLIVRSGVKQLLDFLDRFSNLDPQNINNVHYEILFDEPQHQDEFKSELDKALAYYEMYGLEE